MTDPFANFPTDLEPRSHHLGPFPHGPFQRAVTRALTPPESDVIVATSADGAVAVVSSGDTTRFAADESVTDYHAPLGSGGASLLAETVTGIGGTFDLDSLTGEEADAIAGEFTSRGVAVEREHHATTGVLDVPASFDDWLMSIGKKERHEVRRKRRKLEAEYGPWEVRIRGAEGVDAFCSLHRTAAGRKGGFMTDEMQAYFTDLVSETGAVIHDLVVDDHILASAFGWELDDGYYFYNSAFDAEASKASPGAVLLSALIERQIARNAEVFDFLKGAETYKYRHGAEARPLYRLTGRIP